MSRSPRWQIKMELLTCVRKNCADKMRRRSLSRRHRRRLRSSSRPLKDSSINKEPHVQVISARAAEQIRAGQVLLIMLSIFALVTAGLIAWLYVGRNIVRRLDALGDAMRRIASGDLTVSIIENGRDEIADMARTLSVFRKATVDVAVARLSEAEHTQTSEARRHQLEAATANFEQAVSDIVGALDGASKTMDVSAQAMAEGAGRNQADTIATAASAEETTATVESIASAAEEIATSVRLISAQVSESASVARQAAGEAHTIAAAVEGLASSVEEIGDVSGLIRNIAAQTNLLALNATSRLHAPVMLDEALQSSRRK